MQSQITKLNLGPILMSNDLTFKEAYLCDELRVRDNSDRAERPTEITRQISSNMIAGRPTAGSR